MNSNVRSVCSVIVEDLDSTSGSYVANLNNQQKHSRNGTHPLGKHFASIMQVTQGGDVLNVFFAEIQSPIRHAQIFEVFLDPDVH